MVAVITRGGDVTLLGQVKTTSTTEAIDTTTPARDAAGESGAHAGVEAPNPILPATNELIWGALSFFVLLALMAKFAFPAATKMMQARTDRIREDLDAATAARTEAESVLAEYQRQLADARTEANRIIEEARQTADNLRRDLMARAETEVTELRQRAAEDVTAAKSRAMTDLRSEVTTLAIDLAEKVVGQNLDRKTNEALVESFISQVGAR